MNQPTIATPLESVARQNFERWNAALLAKDAKKVADLYTNDATFLPTVSPDFKKGQEGAEAYFRHFLEKDPKGAVVEEAVQPTSPDSYLHSGMYDFEIGPKEKRETVKARFTFLWKKDADGQWKIAHHHSSQVP